jgi:hypothetical protein
VRRAHAAAYRYPASFAGFRARLTWREDDTGGEGTAIATTTPEIAVEIEGTDAPEWVTRELRSILGHRRAAPYEEGDGRHDKRIAEQRHLLGTLVELDDGLSSAYRIDAEGISTVTRTLHGSRFTITIHDRQPMPDGTSLATAFTVFYWDAETGALTAAESYRDAVVELDGIHLPASRTIVRGDANGLSARRLELAGHELTGVAP